MYSKKKDTLQKILQKSFFKTTIIPLIVIELTLLVLYFGISNFMIKNGEESLEKEIQTNLRSILSHEVQTIDFQLKEISSLASILQNDQEEKFKNKDKIRNIVDSEKFAFAKNGVYYKTNNDGGSSVFYGTKQKIGDTQFKKATFTQSFDNFLKYSVNTNDLVVASYFNSHDDMNRLYPFIPKVFSQYDPKINMEDYNFYYKADQKHNPDKKPVWTSAYLDPAGQGWMVSCVVPIYNKNFLEGVTGLDVTIDSFVKNTLNLKLPWKGYGMLVAGDGTILAMPSDVEKLLGLRELKKHNYTDTIKKTNYKPEDFNIQKNKKLYPYFKELFEKHLFKTTKTIQNKEYILAQQSFEQTDWKLFVIVDKHSVYEPIDKMETLSNNIGIAAVVFMLVFYIIFFILLSKRARNIAFDISEPISKLAQMTQNIPKNKVFSKIEANNIQEIDTLLNNFQFMTSDLLVKRKQLEELNTNLENMVLEEIQKNREKENALLHQSRLAQLGEMISMIAHQWRQPLASISSIVVRLQLKLGLENYDLDSKEGKKEFISYLDKELDNVDLLIQNLTTTIDDFRDFYKPNKKAVYESIINPIEKSLAILKPHLEQSEISIIKKFDDDIPNKKLFVNELIQVFLNLIKNSIDAIKKNDIKTPTITIVVKDIQHLNPKYAVHVEIIDNGGGMDKETLEKAFDPYFSTKDEKNGTGLGLYMSKTIIEQHHSGKINVRCEGDNTTFSIVI